MTTTNSIISVVIGGKCTLLREIYMGPILTQSPGDVGIICAVMYCPNLMRYQICVMFHSDGDLEQFDITDFNSSFTHSTNNSKEGVLCQGQSA